MIKINSYKVLIAVDFEEQSLLALATGVAFAKAISAEITVLHVIDDSGLIGKHLTEAQFAEIKKDADTRLQECVKPFAQAKTRKFIGATLTLRGKVYEKILEHAAEMHASVIILGCRNAAQGGHQFIGSNSLHIIRSSPNAVLTIKRKPHRPTCGTIILPLDLTKETREKVARAIEIAVGQKACVRVISVAFTKDEFVVNRLTRQLAQIKAEFEKASVECTSEIIKGVKDEENLAECIVDYAEKEDGDLLLLMTQQETDATACFIGSAAQEMILRADMPVLSIIPLSVRKRAKAGMRKK